jgi:site-specific DNA-methyltransferase (adenine-specific)
LEVMKEIPDKSIDMILCDLPYGTTACKWDTIIPFEPLWEQYKRIIKDNGAVVLTASQPFTSALVMSNPVQFKYSWIWDKKLPTGHLNANKMPMKRHEDILVFCASKTPYFPTMRTDKMRARGGGKASPVYGKCIPKKSYSDQYYPTSILEIHNADQSKKIHPTQKPVALFEYLIKTYTNKGDLVLDNCIGSGTTAVAAINTGRNYIGIEKDEEYCKIAEERIKGLPAKLL